MDEERRRRKPWSVPRDFLGVGDEVSEEEVKKLLEAKKKEGLTAEEQLRMDRLVSRSLAASFAEVHAVWVQYGQGAKDPDLGIPRAFLGLEKKVKDAKVIKLFSEWAAEDHEQSEYERLAQAVSDHDVKVIERAMKDQM